MTIPSSPADRQAIKRALDEISGSLTRIEAERDLIKEAIANTCDNFDLNKKTFRRMAKVYHKQNFTQEREEHEEFETLYETITNTTSLRESA